MTKYYAVRNGRNPSVYMTWPETEQQIKGYSGAIFKSFSTEEEAKQFISEGTIENDFVCEGIKIYTDGSFSKEKNCYGWGFVVVENGEKIGQQFGFGDKLEYLPSRQIAGETTAVLRAVDYALSKGFSEIEINYDYTGIESWALEDWTAKSPIATDYVNELKQKAEYIDIYFNKIKAHAGDKFNEWADTLAKTAIDNY